MVTVMSAPRTIGARYGMRTRWMAGKMLRVEETDCSLYKPLKVVALPFNKTSD